ncbi:hypothetical protein TCE0_047f18145 [Talaromyces pinophilus]|uniref:CCHC-type domain-containing protein n=1 Tax=Talaromyces pinophilus TaxID=128442 RepID=A0A0B8N2E8_TALPI|nr:hypothetical protein TCE0_047f18145 [Talaromyces pinophilus]
MANSRSTRNRRASAGPSGTARQGDSSAQERSSVGDSIQEPFETIQETQALAETLDPSEGLGMTQARQPPFRSRYEGSPPSQGQAVASAQDVQRLELETQALRRTQDAIQRSQDAIQQQMAEVLTHLTNRSSTQEVASPPPPATNQPTPPPLRDATVPEPPVATTRIVYEKPASKPKPDRFESKNFQEYERWIEDVKNNFEGHTYSEAEKVSTAAAWLKGEHQTRWIEYKKSVDLSRFTFNDFVEWIEARIETRTARSLTAYVDLEEIKPSEMGNPQTFYSKFSHLYDQSRTKAQVNDQDKIMAFIAKLPAWLKLKVLVQNTDFRDMTSCLEETTRLWKLYKDEQVALNKVLKRNRDDPNSPKDKLPTGRPSKWKRSGRGSHKGKPNQGHTQKTGAKDGPPSVTCFRCDRKGHRAPDCYATRHRDGSELPPKDTKRSNPRLNSLSQKSRGENNDDDKDDDDSNNQQ